MVAPLFYRELVGQSATIDATTRNHVAFVVFYGGLSKIICQDNFRYDPYKIFLDGLSISGDPWCSYKDPIKVTMPRLSEMCERSNKKNIFSDRLKDMFISSPEQVNASLFSHHMSKVATRLMEIYKISESALPCMLFVEGEKLSNHLVVRLDDSEPLQSLYRHVLMPLSEEFAKLSDYWKRRDDLARKKGTGRRTHIEAAEKLRTEIAKVNAEIDKEAKIIPMQIRGAREKIEELKATQKEKLVALPERAAQQVQVVQRLENEIIGISIGERKFRSSAEQALKMAKLSKRLFREHQRLSAYIGRHVDEGTIGIRRLMGESEQLSRRIPCLELKRERLVKAGAIIPH
jgi:hypothetical protein